ncbi:MAG: type II/IV secretion system protein [Candidatus Omnitrophica bacterium]|nr:type II/IV secretion system protein [Candidatus Omnitrophota bacterium]
MERLINYLLEKELATEQQIEKAREQQRQSQQPMTSLLIELGILDRGGLLKALSEASGMEVVDLERISPEPAALEKVPASQARLYGVIPLKFQDNSLTIALSDPFNLRVVDDLGFTTGAEIIGKLAPREDIHKAIQKIYGSQLESLGDLVGEIEKKLTVSSVSETDAEKLKDLASQTPVVKLLDTVLLQAVNDKASDVHFEPFENEYRIRYRVDGVIYELVKPPSSLHLAIASRIKVIANLDVAESRLPQDGRIMMTIEGRNVDLRVSTLPTIYGESIVMRVLDKSAGHLGLDRIGIHEDTLGLIREFIQLPNGIILVTGPTGSGKTTTLYSALKEINTVDTKIITTEDPVEYDISGLIQVPINPKIDLTFAKSLRAILRQDPDIIMVGEIRDEETAQIATQAALTGHLVFSTLHTNDAPGAVTRLLDMEVEPFLITSTLRAVIAQRLVRTLCQGCKQEYFPTDGELKDLGVTREKCAVWKHSDVSPRFSRGKGCGQCNQSGYKGLTGIYEIFELNEELRAMIIERVPSSELMRAARQRGMRTLREDGILKILEGSTTVEEVLKETQLS